MSTKPKADPTRSPSRCRARDRSRRRCGRSPDTSHARFGRARRAGADAHWPARNQCHPLCLPVDGYPTLSPQSNTQAPDSADATNASPGDSRSWKPEPSHAAADARADALAWLKAQPNWAKLGPKRKEVVALLVLNELDVETGVLSSRTNRALAEDYSGYTEAQFKHTFAALRRYALARPVEQFIRGRFGKFQGPTRYFLEATPDGQPWAVQARRSQRAREGAAARKARGGLGRLVFSAHDDELAREDAMRRQRGRNAVYPAAQAA